MMINLLTFLCSGLKDSAYKTANHNPNLLTMKNLHLFENSVCYENDMFLGI